MIESWCVKRVGLVWCAANDHCGKRVRATMSREALGRALSYGIALQCRSRGPVTRDGSHGLGIQEPCRWKAVSKVHRRTRRRHMHATVHTRSQAHVADVVGARRGNSVGRARAVVRGRRRVRQQRALPQSRHRQWCGAPARTRNRLSRISSRRCARTHPAVGHVPTEALQQTEVVNKQGSFADDIRTCPQEWKLGRAGRHGARSAGQSKSWP